MMHPSTRLREAAKQTRLAADANIGTGRAERLLNLAASLEAYADRMDDREGGDA